MRCICGVFMNSVTRLAVVFHAIDTYTFGLAYFEYLDNY